MPSLNEQIRISMVMTAIDKNIDVQRKIIEECTKQMSSLFAFLNSGAKELHCFSEIGPLAKTDPLSWGDISYEGKNKCIIYGELFTKYHYQVSKAVSKTNAESKNTSEGNELLFPSSTTVDAVSLISPCALNEAGVIMGGDLFAVRVCSKFNALYLSFLFNCIYKNRLAKYAQGTTIIHLHYDDIKNFRFQSVSLDKQNKICKIMEDELKKIDVEQKELRTIENVKAYLLKNLFV
jgi:type I restriction enzyme S subunit